MADHEQLVLFDIAPHTFQQTTVEEKALGLRKVELLGQVECTQLELDLSSQHPEEIPYESIRLAA